MAINKVQYGNTTLIDLTDTTAVASDVAQGKYFYGKDGVKTLGTASGGNVTSVNGQTGAVVLDADDVNALPEDTEFAIGYDESVSVGTAQVGTAVTATPNYTPSGDVVMDYEIKDNKLYIYGFRFVGSGVNFVVEKNVQSNAVGTGAADYMTI